MWLLALVNGGHVDGQVELLAEATLAQVARVVPGLLMDSLNVGLQVVLPLESGNTRSNTGDCFERKLHSGPAKI